MVGLHDIDLGSVGRRTRQRQQLVSPRKAGTLTGSHTIDLRYSTKTERSGQHGCMEAVLSAV